LPGKPRRVDDDVAHADGGELLKVPTDQRLACRR
jgi:hypothetical protein